VKKNIKIELDYKHLSENEVRMLQDYLRSTDVSILLRDALGEFVDKRSKPDYVTNRYKDLQPYFLARKTLEVSKRIALASILSKFFATIYEEESS
jgi:hypothetical protein